MSASFTVRETISQFAACKKADLNTVIYFYFFSTHDWCTKVNLPYILEELLKFIKLVAIDASEMKSEDLTLKLYYIKIIKLGKRWIHSYQS
jgi:hypothetical protein